MNFRLYLADRIGMISIYLVSLLLVAAVIELDLHGQGLSLTRGNLIYIGVLSVVGVSVFLTLDYMRQRGYWNQLNALKSDPDNPREGIDMEALLTLPAGATREQRYMQDLVRELYCTHVDRLEVYRSMQDQHQTFVRKWVHQMKTPVSVISLLTRQSPLLKESAPSSDMLESIQEENEKLMQGLDMMLNAARLEKFEVDVCVQKVDLLKVVRNVVSERKKACIRYRIFPKLIASHEVCYVDTDEKWLSVIVHQIVSNAIKYSKVKESENKELIITLTKDAKGCYAIFADEGIGIAEQDLPRVFDPFFTGGNGRLLTESTGMGLYIAKEVCRRLGHRLEIESRLGEGTTVRLHFPAGVTLHDGLVSPR
ncbi:MULTISPECIES: sensor histidine kinase [unclassified Paenibacillus]|uniref:sensor histidine kinase n=1 Tax=unclassified Paenibacillus TaxID=185978 RepID=UPI001AE780CC|nr:MULTISPECIES: sensor histidine kinase [unclassified Paenibacillus]MBP1157738.1 signal transduction histidine kinase [Paenibacillus sp. PvP091]MBP1171526.1 signal transduction histidine kinase [Paenibacillus sp. PvR098]MBP2442554.1 signal transduction histidine kinase [Paenibacillus sp. PvP052]